jgi:outer membrane PBP1 activator LpoA protein
MSTARLLQNAKDSWNISGICFALLLLGLLAGCQSTPANSGNAPFDLASASVETLLDAASQADSQNDAEAAAEYRLKAIELLIYENNLRRAATEIDALPAQQLLSDELRASVQLARATIAFGNGDHSDARSLLQELDGRARESLPIDTNIKIALLAGEVYNALGDPSLAAVFQLSRSEGAEYGTPLLARQLSDSIWLTLDTLSIDEIDAVASATAGYHARGWLELNKAIRREEFSLRGQLDALARWQGVWTQHAATSYLPSALLSLNAAWDRRPRHIGLILPLQTAAGRALQEGFIAAYYQSLAISREVPRISVIDSSEATDAFSVYDEALRLGVDLVVGPLDKALVNQIAELPRLPTLTLALNYADNDDESGVGKPSDLVQFGLAPENEIEQIIALARQRGFKRAAVITPEGDNYTRLRATFQSRWEQSGGSVVARSVFGPEEDFSAVVKNLLAIDASEDRARRLRATLPRNNIEFTPQRRSDIDFIFLIANPRQGRQLVPTLAFYYAQDLPLLALPSIYDGDPSASTRDLDGLVFGDAPWMVRPSELRSVADENLAPAFGSSQRLRAMGVDSFYLAMQLTQLRDNPQRSLRGVTGELSLTEDGKIMRKLVMLKFENGVPEPLPGS